MKIAVAYENGEVFQHFGQTRQFKYYDVRGGEVRSSMVIEAAGCEGHEAMAAFLTSLQVQAVICGGIGGGARAAVEQAGMLLYGGVTGSADDAVAALIAGTLNFDPEIHTHSHEAHHGCAHSCGQCAESGCSESGCSSCAAEG